MTLDIRLSLVRAKFAALLIFKIPKNDNIINWVEIPAIDFARAMKFYSEVLQVEMSEMPSPDGKMKCGNFPYESDGSVVSGGIVQMDGFVPTTKGPIIYLNGGDDLNTPLSRVERAEGKMIIPKTRIEKMFMAAFIDTEGSRMRFHSTQ